MLRHFQRDSHIFQPRWCICICTTGKKKKGGGHINTFPLTKCWSTLSYSRNDFPNASLPSPMLLFLIGLLLPSDIFIKRISAKGLKGDWTPTSQCGSLQQVWGKGSRDKDVAIISKIWELLMDLNSSASYLSSSRLSTSGGWRSLKGNSRPSWRTVRHILPRAPKSPAWSFPIWCPKWAS